MDLLGLARAGDGEAFRELVAPHERELRVHCYRMLGSVHDAEDALQDTLLSAWQGLAAFEGRSSLRTWLYRVATSRCLDARRSGRRRAAATGTRTPASGQRPASEQGPASEHGGDPAMADLVVPPPTRLGEVLWLEPYPDDMLAGLPDAAPGPEARYELAEAVSLAFITAIQLLPPRQRAALILRDVLGYRASEAAGLLGCTEESLTSALKRARATVERTGPAGEGRAGRPGPPPAGSAAERHLLSQLTTAFAAADVQAVVALLTDDAWFTMPPLPLEYQGRELAGQFLAATALRPGWTALLAPARARANGQHPAFAFYATDERAGYTHTVGLLVLTLSGDRISSMTRFDPELLPAWTAPGPVPAAREGG
jgi:RNA polymerase sigma-70 factor (ECF subfamily)